VSEVTRFRAHTWDGCSRTSGRRTTRLEAPGELAIRAARCFDIPFSFSASYCLSFFTFARLAGIKSPSYDLSSREIPLGSPSKPARTLGLVGAPLVSGVSPVDQT
jgi:hypothetical protein